MSDAFIVGEDFLSEHFFSSEARNESFHKFVLDRRKVWDDAETETSRTRFTAARGQLAVDLANLHADSDADIDATEIEALYDRIRAVLGYSTGEYAVEVDGPIRRYNTIGVESAAPLAMVDAMPADSIDEIFSREDDVPFPLLKEWERDEKNTEDSLTKAVSALFQEEGGPEFALILAGRWLLMTEQGRWAEGRYLAVDLQTVADRNDGKRGAEIDRALTILEAASLAPDADGQIWWNEALEQSVKHTVGVSQDLREGVRRSIEIIANEVVNRRKAQGLEPLPASEAQPLARQSLRFLYRILFLLYAEASPELGVLPVGATEYDSGYSLDRLRELTLVEIASPKQEHGTHFYESLDVLFRLIDQGHHPAESAEGQSDGLEFHSLRADLFKPDAIAHISEVKLGNKAMQEVLRRLLLSKEAKGRDRGFISYVDLGINQLGAVYEGLMSYTGFFAETDLYEVAKGGNTEKGSWVVPVDRADGIAESDFVTSEDEITGEPKPIVHRAGQFVFRLSGRERQQSASYYTPEVLTKFTVSQALEELLDQDGETTSAEDILSLTICEPALGSGAFAIEAVRQLATQYLKRRQAELGEEIPPEDYPEELQRVKAYIALHNVYGVDLNATAVEFAEITLWLDTMSKGLHAPWFGLHLRRGNSLIGARRSVYTRSDVNSKAWLKQPADAVPLTDLAARIKEDSLEPTDVAGRIHHFLLPAEGWGSTAESKEAKSLIPERVKRINTWRKQFRVKPTKKQVDTLVELSYQVEELWTMALRRLLVAEQQSRRSIQLWGAETAKNESFVTREQIEESLADPNGAYQRLHRVMDAWCALWFWPLTGDEVAPPTWEEWIDALTMLLGSNKKGRKLAQDGAAPLSSDNVWDALAENEAFAIQASNAQSVQETLNRHPWLSVCEQVATEQGFFHWQLDFAMVFARDGFDLQVGNPPWVRPDSNVDALRGEYDPWWQLAVRPHEHERQEHIAVLNDIPGANQDIATEDSAVAATRTYVGSDLMYPALAGLHPDLYRCFMLLTWENTSHDGISAMVHWDTHFTEDNAGPFRAETYPRLRRHWEFINELQLFKEIGHQKHFAVSVWGTPRDVNFLNATAIYHPTVVERSLRHDGQGPQPGFKFEKAWDLRPHQARINHVDARTLGVWNRILQAGNENQLETKMVYAVNRDIGEVLTALASGDRVESYRLSYANGWDETEANRTSLFRRAWGPALSLEDTILQGPHVFVSNPFFKSPNPTMRSKGDWAEVDLEALGSQGLHTTAFKPGSKWNAEVVTQSDPLSTQFRVIWRQMAANAGERTLIPALMPPGPIHVNMMTSASVPEPRHLVLVTGLFSSLLADLSVRAVPKNHINPSTINRLPALDLEHPLGDELSLRTLRLNAMAGAYAPLWRACWRDSFSQDQWASDEDMQVDLAPSEMAWSWQTPLRIPLARRQALLEIDALVAIMLGVTADQLCTVYRTQFAVLHGYDQDDYLYDTNGRLVPTPVRQAWRKQGEDLSDADRTHTNAAGNTYIYELPFRVYDREYDMRVAYAEFGRRLAEQ